MLYLIYNNDERLFTVKLLVSAQKFWNLCKFNVITEWLQFLPGVRHLKIMSWGKINSPIINKSLSEVYMEELTSIV